MSLLSEHQEQQAAPVGTGHPVLPRVNLLPPEIGEAVRFRRIQLGSGGGLLAALGTVTLLYVLAVGSVNDATPSCRRRRPPGRSCRPRTPSTPRSRRLRAGRGSRGHADPGDGRGGPLLAVPQRPQPDGPGEGLAQERHLHPGRRPARARVDGAGLGTVTFTGVGYSHEDVAVWLESLAKQQGYKDPYFSSSTEVLVGTRKAVDFASTVTLTSDALSEQYTAAAGG
jgi:hypothetical protein